MQNLASNSLLNDHQHGFCPGRQCELLLRILNDWTQCLDNKIPVDILYLDYHMHLIIIIKYYIHQRYFHGFITKRVCITYRGRIIMYLPLSVAYRKEVFWAQFCLLFIYQ